MYGERTAKKSIGPLGPYRFSSGPSFGFLAPVGRFVKTAVESLDPRFIASEGGRSVQHVVGDATELGRSIITGEDTLSESPTARAYQAAGGGAPGVLAAALPYVNVGTAVLPTTKVLTPAGRAALGADAAERLAQKQILTTGVTPGVRPRVGIGSTVVETAPAPPPIPATGPVPKGMYSIQDASGNVRLYQIDDSGNISGMLRLQKEPLGFVVSDMSSNPGSPVAANLLAAAKIIGQQQFPETQFPLWPSKSLSQFSRPLVEKLQAAGLVDPNYVLPEVGRLNTIENPFGIGGSPPAFERPRLVPISKQEVSQTTRELIQKLAQAKREGRLSPDTLTRSSELKAELARKLAAEQDQMQGIIQASAQRQLDRRATQRAAFGVAPDQPLSPDQIAMRARSVMGPDDARLALTLLDSPPNEMVEELLSLSDLNELLITPIDDLTRTGTVDRAEVSLYLEDLVTSLQYRLMEVDPGVYNMADERFYDAVLDTVVDIWEDYGGTKGQQIIGAMS
jgi:hypothetical protein